MSFITAEPKKAKKKKNKGLVKLLMKNRNNRNEKRSWQTSVLRNCSKGAGYTMSRKKSTTKFLRSARCQ